MADKRLVDPLGRECVFADSTWERHILVNHPDMDGDRDHVERAVSVPRSIWRSAADPDVRIYYGAGPSPHLLVAVKVNLMTKVLLTAHLARRESGASLEWPLPAK